MRANDPIAVVNSCPQQSHTHKVLENLLNLGWCATIMQRGDSNRATIDKSTTEALANKQSDVLRYPVWIHQVITSRVEPSMSGKQGTNASFSVDRQGFADSGSRLTHQYDCIPRHVTSLVRIRRRDSDVFSQASPLCFAISQASNHPTVRACLLIVPNSTPLPIA